MIQVILRDRLQNLGNAGEVVTVRPGYARNYLIPKGLAYEATEANVLRLEREHAKVQKQAAELLVEARKRAGSIEGVSITFQVRAAEEGKLFGSITTSDIAEQLAEQGIEVDRKQIQLDEPLKSLGVFSVPVRLHAEVQPEVKVWVIKEE